MPPFKPNTALPKANEPGTAAAHELAGVERGPPTGQPPHRLAAPDTPEESLVVSVVESYEVAMVLLTDTVALKLGRW